MNRDIDLKGLSDDELNDILMNKNEYTSEHIEKVLEELKSRDYEYELSYKLKKLNYNDFLDIAINPENYNKEEVSLAKKELKTKYNDDIEFLKEIIESQSRDVKTIKNIAIFFAVLTAIGVLLNFISFSALQNIFSNIG